MALFVASGEGCCHLPWLVAQLSNLGGFSELIIKSVDCIGRGWSKQHDLHLCLNHKQFGTHCSGVNQRSRMPFFSMYAWTQQIT